MYENVKKIYYSYHYIPATIKSKADSLQFQVGFSKSGCEIRGGDGT
jgi:hypothetical protein